jgi:hypothetical protein
MGMPTSSEQRAQSIAPRDRLCQLPTEKSRLGRANQTDSQPLSSSEERNLASVIFRIAGFEKLLYKESSTDLYSKSSRQNFSHIPDTLPVESKTTRISGC